MPEHQQQTQSEQPFECWAILELMGHRRMAGLVTEQTIGGQAFVRIDVPESATRQKFTQFYGAGSIYCLTPTTEKVARDIAARMFVQTVEGFSPFLPVAVMTEEDYEVEATDIFADQ